MLSAEQPFQGHAFVVFKLQDRPSGIKTQRFSCCSHEWLFLLLHPWGSNMQLGIHLISIAEERPACRYAHFIKMRIAVRCAYANRLLSEFDTFKNDDLVSPAFISSNKDHGPKFTIFPFWRTFVISSPWVNICDKFSYRITIS